MAWKEELKKRQPESDLYYLVKQELEALVEKLAKNDIAIDHAKSVSDKDVAFAAGSVIIDAIVKVSEALVSDAEYDYPSIEQPNPEEYLD